MPFTRSTDDVRRMQAMLRRPVFSGLKSIAATFRTDPAVVERLLPPPLRPTEPLGRVWVADIQASNIAGAFTGAGLDLAAEHDGRQGWYCLAMPMSTDAAVQVGRETLGEPKKLCDVRLERDGGALRGTVVRRGVTLLTLEVTPGDDAGPAEQETLSFHYKYLLACDGDGYDAPPQLIYKTDVLSATETAAGPAQLTLASSPHDGFDAVPVLEMGPGVYAAGEDVIDARVACSVDPDAFLPWAYGNADDWLVFAQVQKRVHGLAPRAAASS